MEKESRSQGTIYRHVNAEQGKANKKKGTSSGEQEVGKRFGIKDRERRNHPKQEIARRNR